MCTCRSAIWMLRAASGVAVVALLVFGPVGAVSDVPDGAAADASPESAGVQRAAADSFRVQLYATTDRDAAETFQADARQWWAGVEGEAPREVFGTNPSITIEQEDVYHRVRMGAFSSRAQARRAQSFLRRQYPDAFVVESAGAARSAAGRRGSALDRRGTAQHTGVRVGRSVSGAGVCHDGAGGCSVAPGGGPAVVARSTRAGPERRI